MCIQPHSGSDSEPDRCAFLDAHARPDGLPVLRANDACPNAVTILRSHRPQRRADHSAYHAQPNSFADGVPFARSDRIADGVPVARTHTAALSHPDGPAYRFADERTRGFTFSEPDGGSFDEPDVRTVPPANDAGPDAVGEPVAPAPAYPLVRGVRACVPYT